MRKVEHNIGMYQFDFARNFFSSPKSEEAKRTNYLKRLGDFKHLHAKAISSAADLLGALLIYDDLLVEFFRHYTYHYLRYALNTEDLISQAICSKLAAEFDEQTAFFRLDLIQIDDAVLNKYIKENAELEVYRFAIESTHRYREHTLSYEQELILSKTLPFISEWEYDLYERLLQRIDFGYVRTPQGGLEVLRQRATIANHPDHAVREVGFKRLFAGYRSQRDVFSFVLINLVKSRNYMAQLHHFEDASSEVYFNSFWSKAEVTNLLGQIQQQAGVYKRYQQLRAEHTREVLGGMDVNIWDIPANLPGNSTPRYSIDAATKAIRETLFPFGKEYEYELASLFDPANGRMDILPGSHRKSGGFSKGFPGVSTVFFSHGFEGYYNDMRVLMHESTHAMHRQLMSNHHVRPAYSQGPNYLFESFAIFNELLLPDYLYQHEPETHRRQFYLEQFLEGKGMALFFVGQDAALEQEIYQEVGSGKVETPDDLDALTQRITSKFDIWVDHHDELKMRWIANRLFYEDPFYEINYVFGSLLALKYYTLYLQTPKSFISQYLALMSNGFDAAPESLLNRFLEIDLHDPHLVSDVVEILQIRVDRLEDEYSHN